MDTRKISDRPVRILHVVGGMDRGGVETWLMHILHHIDRDRYRMDFLVHTTKHCAYDDEIRALGCEIIPCLHPSRPWRYARNFLRILRERTPYDVVHSHVHHFSGLVLKLAHRAGVPARIAHSHNDTASVEARARLPRRLYTRLTGRWIVRHATLGLAASPRAAASLYGPSWGGNPGRRILYYGIDLSPFRASPDRAAVRQEMGIPTNAFVLGHVGRFCEQKNHTFLLEIASELAQNQPDMYLLLVGDGPLRPQIERKAAALRLAGRVIFAGVRPDVPRLMLGCMDAFVFPSCFEGLGLAVVEAQAAGLPCVISDVIPEDVDIVKPLIQRVDLGQPVSVWVRALANLRSSMVSRSEALRVLEESPFGIESSVAGLAGVYDV